MLVNLSTLVPDKNQPRRIFNVEKMKALQASMLVDGFRLQSPIIIDEKNVIIDGERRYRAAKAVGIKQVPVEVKKDISEAERLMYQLQSEGAEMEISDRNDAWIKLYELFGGSKESAGNKGKVELAKILGVPKQTFVNIVNNHYDAEDLIKALSKGTRRVLAIEERPTKVMATIQRADIDSKDKVKMAEKAIDEKWSEDKTQEIRKAMEERPARSEQILSQNYSDYYEGSTSWKLTLEAVKSDVDITKMQHLDDTLKFMKKTVDAYQEMVLYGLKFVAAMKRFDYTEVTPSTRIKAHKNLLMTVPFAHEFLSEFEDYMINAGELENKTIKKLK